MPSTYTPIASQTLTSPTAGVTFSSIPSTYTDLVLVVSAGSSFSSGSPSCEIQFNSDTSTNYSYTQLVGNGSVASTARGSNQTRGAIGNIPTTAGQFGTIVAHIQNYANNTTNKSFLARSSDARNFVIARINLWRSTSAITSIYVFDGTASNFTTGSTFALYGIKVA